MWYVVEDVLLILLVAIWHAWVLFQKNKNRLLYRLHILQSHQKGILEVQDVDDEEHQFSQQISASNSLPGTPAASSLSAVTAGHEPLDVLPRTVRESLKRMRNYIIRDFVDSWYKASISDSESFPREVRKAIDYAFWSLSERALSVDWTEFVMEQVLVFITDMLRNMRIMEELLLENDSGFSSLSEEQKMVMIMGHFSKNYNLHPGVNDPKSFLRSVCGKICKVILPPSEYNCAIARYLVREILAFNVMTPVMGFCCPYWINYGICAAARNTEAKKVLDSVPEGDEENKELELEGEEFDETQSIGSIDKDSDLGIRDSFGTPRTSETAALHLAKLTSTGSDTIDKALFNDEDEPEEDSPLIPSEPPSHESMSRLNAPPSSGSSGFSQYHVNISSWSYRSDKAHKIYVVYKLEIKHKGRKWSVWKRFSDFRELHKNLKSSFPSFKAKLPSRKLFTDLDREFISKRASDLNRYIQDGLLFNASVIESEYWRIFLVPSGDICEEDQSASDDSRSVEKKKANKTGFSGDFSSAKMALNSALMLSTKSVLDKDVKPPLHSVLMSTSMKAIGNAGPEVLSSRCHLKASSSTKTITSAPTPPTKSSSTKSSSSTSSRRRPSLQLKVRLFGSISLMPGQNYSPNLTKPIFDFIGELFEMERRGWVKRQIIWVVTAAFQAMDTSLAKIYAEKFSDITNEGNMASIIDLINNAVWPNGSLKKPGTPLTPEDMEKTASEAKEGLASLVPDVLKTFVGAEFCEARLYKLYGYLQMEPFVKHISFVIIDKILATLLEDKKGVRESIVSRATSASELQLAE